VTRPRISSCRLPRLDQPAEQGRLTPGEEEFRRADGYLEILDAHGVRCAKLVTDRPPGRIIYEDGDQIVVVPFGA
jgi:hypothetical protein